MENTPTNSINGFNHGASLWKRGSSCLQKAYFNSGLNRLRLQNPLANKASAIQAIAAAALALMSTSFAILAAASVVSLPLALPLTIISGLSAAYFLAVSLLKIVPRSQISIPVDSADQETKNEEKKTQDLQLNKKKEALFSKLGGKIAIDNSEIESSLEIADKVKIRHLALIEALGGLLAVAALPELEIKDHMANKEGHICFISPEEMSAAVMKGQDKLGRPFIALRCQDNSEGKSSLYVDTLYQETVENPWHWNFGFRVRGNKEPQWACDPLYNGDDFKSGIIDPSVSRIARLIKKEPVGAMVTDFLENEKNVLADGQSAIALV